MDEVVWPPGLHRYVGLAVPLVVAVSNAEPPAQMVAEFTVTVKLHASPAAKSLIEVKPVPVMLVAPGVTPPGGAVHVPAENFRRVKLRGFAPASRSTGVPGL